MSTLAAITAIAKDWAVRSFGLDHVRDRIVRSERTLEEMAELCQAVGLSEERASAVIKMVYSRPSGNSFQEAGGTVMTLLVLLDLIGVDPEFAALVELRRVLNKPPSHFTKRNDDKVQLLAAKTALGTGDLS